MSLPRYESYKTSGVEWLGDVPEHWGVFPTKRSFSRRKELNPGMRCENRLALTLGGVVPRDLYDLEGLQASEFETYQLFQKDDLVFKLIDLQNIKTSRVGIVPEKGIMSPAYIRLEPDKNRVVSKFAYWFFTNLYNLCIFNELGGGVRQTLGPDELLLLSFLTPEHHEQTLISSFLDRETAKIDALIAEQLRLIALLAEKRQATISHAVTKGLNPRAPMKHSGIVWLGDVPEHWEVRKLGGCTTITRLAGAEYTAFWEVDDTGQIVALRGQNIKANALDITDCERISEELSQKLIRSRLFKGDVVYPCVGSIGNAALIEENDRYHINQNIAKLTPNPEKVYPGFLAHFLNSKVALESALFLNTSDAQPSILVGNMRKIKMPLPSVEEQKKIADYLADRTGEFDTLTAEAQRAIILLQERRTALISAAVTGKINVQGVA